MAEGPSKTFFSYAREDLEFVLPLVKDLRAAGAAVWLDLLDIGAGLHWDTEIEKALRECPRHVIVLSPASVNSQNVMDEVSFALEQRKQVIPLLYRDCQIPFRLRRVQYIDFRGEYAEGIQDLLKAVGAAPQSAMRRTPESAATPTPPPSTDKEGTGEGYYARGQNYYKKKEYDNAIDAFTQAIRLKPDYAEAHNDRGVTYKDIGQYDRAIQDYDQALKINASYALAYSNRGVAYDNKGQYDRAIQDYDQALKIDPNYALAYNNRGSAYYSKGDYARAIQDYDQALKIDPNYANVYNKRGLAYEHEGDQSRPTEQKLYYRQAIQDFDDALKIAPNYATSQENRNRVAAKLEKVQNRRPFSFLGLS